MQEDSFDDSSSQAETPEKPSTASDKTAAQKKANTRARRLSYVTDNVSSSKNSIRPFQQQLFQPSTSLWL